MKLEIPLGDYDAYLFDCDGTIADSMPLHYHVWSETLGRLGCEFPEPLSYEWAGVPIAEVVNRLNARNGLSMPIQETLKQREEIYYRSLPFVQPIPEVIEQIELNYGRIPLAVVSGSPRESVVRTLSTLGVLDRFQTLVTAEDTARGKPAPDPYLLAAERLGVEPTRCLVFEDGEAGFRSAEAAGMKWVRVVSPQLRGR